MGSVPRSESVVTFGVEGVQVLLAAFLPGRQVTDLAFVDPAPPSLERRVEELATRLGIAQVEVYIWAQDRPDAIPLGTRNSGTLVVTSGMLEVLQEDELDAALLHELAHIRYDHGKLLAALALGAAGSLSFALAIARRRSGWYGWPIVMLALLAVALGIPATVRQLERQADSAAGRHLEDPTALARAIIAVRTGSSAVDLDSYESTPSVAERFLSPIPHPVDRFPWVGPD